MRIGIFGTGLVGKTLATALVGLGHEVMLGSRTADNAAAAEWVAEVGPGASQGTFADAAAHGELLFNCTPGTVSLDAIGSTRAEDLAGKTLVDVANALEPSPTRPTVVASTESLAERIQDAFPTVRVVKALNTVNRQVMVEPARVPGDHDIFVCGNDADAKADVAQFLQQFGWRPEHIVDLGDLTAARAMELYLPLWIRLRTVTGTADFNIRVVR